MDVHIVGAQRIAVHQIVAHHEAAIDILLVVVEPDRAPFFGHQPRLVHAFAHAGCDAGHARRQVAYVLQVEVAVLIAAHEQALLREVVHQFGTAHETRLQTRAQIVPLHVLQ